MFDGKAFGQEIVAATKAFVERSLAPVLSRLALLETAVAKQPKPCSDEDLVNRLREFVAGEVARAVSSIPAPKDGEPGRDGQPGKDIDPAAVERLVGEMVAAAMTALPAPQNGRDGMDGKDGDPGEPGRDGTPGHDGRDGIDGKPGEPGTDGKDGRDGIGLAGALIGRDGNLILTLTDGSTRDLGAVVGKDGAPGRDGRDGAAASDAVIDVIYDGQRSLTVAVGFGTRVTEKTFTLPIMIHRGIYAEGAAYERGDVVTWAGSQWHCNEATGQRPGESAKAWSLVVKRGRDGKDGRDLSPPANVPVKLGGK